VADLPVTPAAAALEQEGEKSQRGVVATVSAPSAASDAGTQAGIGRKDAGEDAGQRKDSLGMDRLSGFWESDEKRPAKRTFLVGGQDSASEASEDVSSSPVASSEKLSENSPLLEMTPKVAERNAVKSSSRSPLVELSQHEPAVAFSNTSPGVESFLRDRAQKRRRTTVESDILTPLRSLIKQSPRRLTADTGKKVSFSEAKQSSLVSPSPQLQNSFSGAETPIRSKEQESLSSASKNSAQSQSIEEEFSASDEDVDELEKPEEPRIANLGSKKIPAKKQKRTPESQEDDDDSSSDEDEKFEMFKSVERKRGRVIEPKFDPTKEPISPGKRRSKRRRWRPLEHWRGERLVVRRKMLSNEDSTVEVEVAEKMQAFKTPAPRKRSRKQTSSGKAKKDEEPNRHLDFDDVKVQETLAKIPGDLKFSSENEPIIMKNEETNETMAKLFVAHDIAYEDYSALPVPDDLAFETSSGKEEGTSARATARLDEDEFISGSLVLPPLSSKPVEVVGDYTQALAVTDAHEGALILSLENKSYKLKKGDHFWVGRGMAYGLTNFSETTSARLVFFVIKPEENI